MFIGGLYSNSTSKFQPLERASLTPVPASSHPSHREPQLSPSAIAGLKISTLLSPSQIIHVDYRNKSLSFTCFVFVFVFNFVIKLKILQPSSAPCSSSLSSRRYLGDSGQKGRVAIWKIAGTAVIAKSQGLHWNLCIVAISERLAGLQ